MSIESARPVAGARIPVKLHRRVCLVQTEDAVLAEELLARKKLARDIVGRLTDCVLLVRPGRVESVDADLSYKVEFAGRSTETYRVRVFEYPELQRTDAQLQFPEYTSLVPTTVEDIRHVTAVEGTELTLLCHLNKEVATARLIDEKAHEEIALAERNVAAYREGEQKGLGAVGVNGVLVDAAHVKMAQATLERAALIAKG